MLPKMIAKLLQQWLHGGCGEQTMHVVQELTKCLVEQSLRLGRQQAESHQPGDEAQEPACP